MPPAVRRTPGLALVGLLLVVSPGSIATAGRGAADCGRPSTYSQPAPTGPHYLLRVRLQPERRLASGDLRVSFTPDLSTDRLVFRLWPNGRLQRRAGARLSVSGVRAAGRPVLAQLRDPTSLVVPLSTTLAAGRRVVVALRWQLRLPRGGADRIDSASDSIRLASFFPILGWEPGHGWALDPAPLMPAESSTSPVADFDVRVSAPPTLRVLASGSRVAPGRWRSFAVRDVAVVAGRFAVVSRTISAPRPVRVTVAMEAGGGAVPPTSSPVARTGTPGQFLARAAGALASLARLYGPYPWPSFTAVVERDLPSTGGIEYPTLVFLGWESLLTAVSHEAAHQWFYSLVGNDQGRDPWLDEGLATWAQTQVDPASQPYFLQRPIPEAARGMLGAPIAYWNAHQSAYAAGVYAQGVQALAAAAPPASVNCALRRHVRRHAYGIARQADLLHELEAVAPGARRTLLRFGARSGGS